MIPRVFTEPPAIVGHRGLGAGVVLGQVENTLGSFLAAVEAGLQWVEVDVRRTLDDQLFVAHDAAFGNGAFLAEMTAAEASGQGALRIEELLEALPSEAGVVFDVKSSLEDAGRAAGGTTAALLARIGTSALKRRPTMAASFDPGALRHLRHESPELPLGLLTWLHFPIGHAVAAAAHLDVQVLAVHAGSLWPNEATAPIDIPSLQRIVSQVHRSDRQLLVWCPSPEQAQYLVAAGVDALVVDDVPAQLRSLTPAGAGLHAAELTARLGTKPRESL
ncbi:glycerophosphodiester phosphodiesterase [Kribbella sancticallisti]|uniref:glycerophosphodiester phosphodiesterase n=1 Tax=Kribbella sancticallisti TaxID=460087 RepID=UPI0031D85742